MVMKMTVRSRTYAGLLPGFGSGLELKIKDLGSMVNWSCLSPVDSGGEAEDTLGSCSYPKSLRLQNKLKILDQNYILYLHSTQYMMYVGLNAD